MGVAQHSHSCSRQSVPPASLLVTLSFSQELKSSSRVVSLKNTMGIKYRIYQLSTPESPSQWIPPSKYVCSFVTCSFFGPYPNQEEDQMTLDISTARERRGRELLVMDIHGPAHISIYSIRSVSFYLPGSFLFSEVSLQLLSFLFLLSQPLQDWLELLLRVIIVITVSYGLSHHQHRDEWERNQAGLWRD